MECAKKPDNARLPVTLDQPNPSVPSVDRPWDAPSERARRRRASNGDRSAHRVHHVLYEDVLN